MSKRSINRLPVVGGGRLVGIVTRADVVRAFARSDHELAQEIRNDVLRDTLWIDPDELGVGVEDGAVVLSGIVDTRTIAALTPGYIGLVPGVVSVDASGLRWRRDDLARRGVTTKLGAGKA
jgi:CBS domain-containing protein